MKRSAKLPIPEGFTEYLRCLGAMDDLPDYVDSTEYARALMQWLAQNCGNRPPRTMVFMALHHEMDGRKPMFDYPRP